MWSTAARQGGVVSRYLPLFPLQFPLDLWWPSPGKVAPTLVGLAASAVGGGDAAVSTGGSNSISNSSSSFTTGGGIAVTRPEVPLAIPSMRPGTSLGCVVPLATKERIWRGEFVDFAQLYPENASTAMAHAHRGMQK